MGESVDKLMQILRKEEYEKAEQESTTLTESINELYDAMRDDRHKKKFTDRQLDYELALAKEVITECVSNLYMASLVIDEPEKYSDSLRKGMREQCMSIMESANSVHDLEVMFENASPYVKSMFPLIEAIAENKTEEDVEDFDTTKILTPEDKKLIDDFEKAEGKDTYAGDLQDRIIDVYKKEQELGEERKEKVQDVVNALAEMEAKKAERDKENGEESEANPITESIEKGLNMFSYVPETIFNAIFLNKSKMIMNESAEGADLMSNAEEILAETICTYTLLECIHSLGLKTFTDEDKNNLRYSFFVN